MNLKDFFDQNMLSYIQKETASAILMGVYAEEERAREGVEALKNTNLQAPGLVSVAEWHIIMANPIENKLFSLPLTDYYIGSLAFFSYNIDSGNLPIAIGDSDDAADTAIDLFRIAE